MTPKEKAKELLDKMLNEQSFTQELYDAKQCALIAVDEILKSHYKPFTGVVPSVYDYWQGVKQEIEKL